MGWASQTGPLTTQHGCLQIPTAEQNVRVSSLAHDDTRNIEHSWCSAVNATRSIPPRDATLLRQHQKAILLATAMSVAGVPQQGYRNGHERKRRTTPSFRPTDRAEGHFPSGGNTPHTDYCGLYNPRTRRRYSSSAWLASPTCRGHLRIEGSLEHNEAVLFEL